MVHNASIKEQSATFIKERCAAHVRETAPGNKKIIFDDFSFLKIFLINTLALNITLIYFI